MVHLPLVRVNSLKGGRVLDQNPSVEEALGHLPMEDPNRTERGVVAWLNS